ncbi:MAG: protein translocase subunit SecD [Bacteroidota bacterium]
MQGNGFKIFSLLAFIALSLFYLFPTLQNQLYENTIEELQDTEREEYIEANYEAIEDAKIKALNLGLDLQGGMHVMLEVGVDNLLRELATNRDETFTTALAATRARTEAGDNGNTVDIFYEELQRVDPEVRLSRYFRNVGETLSRRSENDEVLVVLKEEATDAVTRAVSIIRQRVDRFGVSEPSIQKQGESRVAVELPGVDDPQRVRDLLRGTARLEFRLMADPQELQEAAQGIYTYYEEQAQAANAAAAPADTTAAEDAPSDEATADAADTDIDLFEGDAEADPATGEVAEMAVNPLQSLILPGQGTVFARVAERDTAEVRALVTAPAVRNLLPQGVELMYNASARAETEQGEGVFELLGVRTRVELTGDVLTDSRIAFDPATNAPGVSLDMNAEGAQKWSRITGANVGKQVAVVLDNVVYSDPVVRGKISGGQTRIDGVSRQEAQDIVTVLKSGALPAPVNIIEERTVGPSLGAKSITAGTWSVIIGFMLVVVFMVLYYQTAGLIANVALLLNVLFLFGILAAFGATLTLPGIAGIVLTIGMAVDANVIIFDRIREEMRAGKTLKSAISGGYDKALSAILDANITTFLTGVILYSFGVGPIQGFAVTLMAGIMSSLFTAIVVTRLLFDYLVSEKRRTVAFG